MGRLEGKVASITGAARGQGRSYAVRMAEEGASIIAVDICEQIPRVFYPMATKEDLDESVALVEAVDGRIVAKVADVRDKAALQSAYEAGIREFGRVDTVLLPGAGHWVQQERPAEVTQELLGFLRDLGAWWT